VDLTLVLTHQCNLRCRYCYTGRKFDQAMPFAIAKQAVDFGLSRANQGRIAISFFGGEPLLEFELLAAIVAYANARAADHGIPVTYVLPTNGTLLNDTILSFLREQKIHVQLSLDGDHDAQDRVRPFADGSGTHAAIARNAQRLAEAGCLHRIVAVIDPATAPRLADSFVYLRELGAKEIHFSPNYLGDWNESACAGFEAGLRALGDTYRDSFRAGRRVVMDPFYGKIITHLMSHPERAPRCGFGKAEIAVAPSGNLYPCDRIVHEDTDSTLRIGHVSTGIDEAKVAALSASRESVDPECADCSVRPRCGQWCGCVQMETTGRLGEVSPLFCWFERAFIAEADRLANQLFDERNPAFLAEFYALKPAPKKRAPFH
jgi:uncharacterized protein